MMGCGCDCGEDDDRGACLLATHWIQQHLGRGLAAPLAFEDQFSVTRQYFGCRTSYERSER